MKSEKISPARALRITAQKQGLRALWRPICPQAAADMSAPMRVTRKSIRLTDGRNIDMAWVIAQLIENVQLAFANGDLRAANEALDLIEQECVPERELK